MKNADASSLVFTIRSPRAQAWQLPRNLFGSVAGSAAAVAAIIYLPLVIAPLPIVESGKGLARFAQRRSQEAEAISARRLRRPTVGGARQ
jgi:5,10-methenyltetrahydromethanopterin hydrogenase